VSSVSGEGDGVLDGGAIFGRGQSVASVCRGFEISRVVSSGLFPSFLRVRPVGILRVSVAAKAVGDHFDSVGPCLSVRTTASRTVS
jgi:hypothetical protein